MRTAFVQFVWQWLNTSGGLVVQARFPMALGTAKFAALA